MREAEVFQLLTRGGLELSPLRFVSARLMKELPSWADAAYVTRWKGKQQVTFLVTVRGRVTSQVLAVAAQQTKALASDATRTFPLVVVPYLSPASLSESEQLGISAVDLCGNGVVQVPGQWLVVRSGKRNRFGGGDPLRSAYRGVASLVARAFAVQPAFSRVTDIRTFIEKHGARITLATVSKALVRLEEDLVIERAPRSIRLLQPDKLLEKLQASYQPPQIQARLAVKSKLSEPELYQRLRGAAESLGGRLVLTGISAASRQAVLAAEPMTSFYCSVAPDDLARLAELEPAPQRHFAAYELLQTADERVFFDPREDEHRPLSSPVQTWLELATGDKRSEEVARELRLRFLRDIEARQRRESHGG